MKVLLDENITTKSVPVLEKYGHDVIHVLHRFDGLIWLRGFLVTNKSYENVMDTIGFFLKNKGDSIKNTYYNMRKKGDSYELIQRFPKVIKSFTEF